MSRRFISWFFNRACLHHISATIYDSFHSAAISLLILKAVEKAENRKFHELKPCEVDFFTRRVAVAKSWTAQSTGFCNVNWHACQVARFGKSVPINVVKIKKKMVRWHINLTPRSNKRAQLPVVKKSNYLRGD